MNKLATRIKNVGPGALVAAAFIGPGGRFLYTLL